MEESILQSIKLMLGIDKDCTDFDQSLIIHINSVCSAMHQLGSGCMIDSAEDTWSQKLYWATIETFAMIKSYVYLKVKLLFDPPTNSAVIEAMNRQISELEWRLTVSGDLSQNGI